MDLAYLGVFAVPVVSVSAVRHLIACKASQKGGDLISVTRCLHGAQGSRRQSEFALECAVECGEAVEAPAEGDVGHRSSDAGRAREGGPALLQPPLGDILRKADAGGLEQ